MAKALRIMDYIGMLLGLSMVIIGFAGGFIPAIVIGLMMLAYFSSSYYKSVKRKPDEKENT